MESGMWYVNFSPNEIGKVMDKKKLFLENENFNKVLINIMNVAYFCRYIKVIVKKTSRIFENLIT